MVAVPPVRTSVTRSGCQGIHTEGILDTGPRSTFTARAQVRTGRLPAEQRDGHPGRRRAIAPAAGSDASAGRPSPRSDLDSRPSPHRRSLLHSCPKILPRAAGDVANPNGPVRLTWRGSAVGADQFLKCVFRNLPVCDALHRAMSSGVPVATTAPPACPPSGPRSMT